MDSLQAADTDVMFLDWGRSAQFLEVQSDFDVETGRLEEQAYRTDIRVLVMEDHPQPLGEVVAAVNLTRKLLLVRERELPVGGTVTSGRIVLDEAEYAIRAVRKSSLTGVIVLECVTDGRFDS